MRIVRDGEFFLANKGNIINPQDYASRIVNELNGRRRSAVPKKTRFHVSSDNSDVCGPGKFFVSRRVVDDFSRVHDMVILDVSVSRRDGNDYLRIRCYDDSLMSNSLLGSVYDGLVINQRIA